MTEQEYRCMIIGAQKIIMAAMEFMPISERSYSLAYFAADVASIHADIVERGNALYAIEKTAADMPEGSRTLEILQHAFNHLQMRLWILEKLSH